MNYVALVSLGAAVGPFFSSAIVYGVKTVSSRYLGYENWIGLNFGMLGQTVSVMVLAGTLLTIQSFSAGMRIFMMFLVWGALNAFNNVFTIYFNAHTLHRLGRHERGRFIANILTLFTMANSIGSMMYGWALASGHVDAQVRSASVIVSAAVVGRLLIVVGLRSDSEGRETVLLRRSD